MKKTSSIVHHTRYLHEFEANILLVLFLGLHIIEYE